MVTPTWPSSLPPPRATSDYGYQQTAPFIRTTMDSGKSRKRRRFITVPTTITVSFVLTKSQLATFEVFWQNDLEAGELKCMMPVINGQGKNSLLVDFTEAYQVKAVDGAKDIFTVTATVETLSMPVNS